MLAALAVLFSFGAPASADGQAIRVQIKDNKIPAGSTAKPPVPGVKVTVTDSSGKEIGTGVTDAKGIALVPVPKADDYVVKVDESTLPKGRTLAANTPAQTNVSSDRFRTDTVTINYFLGEASRVTTGYWSQLAQRLADGARLGLILAMCAVGLSLIFGTTGLTNFAHGEMVTFGAMMAYIFEVWGVPFLLASALAIFVAGAGFGLLLNEGVFSPLRKRHIGLISQLVITVGLSILLKNLFLFRFGGRTKFFRAFANQAAISIGPVKVTTRDLTTSLISLGALIIVAIALQRTRIGKATRAVSDNADLASTTGIDSQRIIRIVWLVGGSLAAMGGIFRGLDEGISSTMGSDLLFLMFAGITLGGLGSAYGALVGSFIIGLFVEVCTLGMPVFPKHLPGVFRWLHDGVPTELKAVPALVALIVILLVRPQGILGRRERVG